LEDGGLGELEVHAVGGELFVDVGHSFKTAFHQVLVHRVKGDLFGALARDSGLDLAASHVGGRDDIVEDSEVDGLKSARAGAHLALVVDG